MAQKIILFLSDLKEEVTGKDYYCQDDKDKLDPLPGVRTLRNLPDLLPESGYSAACSPERLAQISRNCLYIKALRNMANHANDRPTDDRNELMDYLAENGYAHPATVSLSGIEDAILTALEHLQGAGEENRGV